MSFPFAVFSGNESAPILSRHRTAEAAIKAAKKARLDHPTAFAATVNLNCYFRPEILL
jgi:hypothetical protein